jgi:hypothetical protein
VPTAGELIALQTNLTIGDAGTGAAGRCTLAPRSTPEIESQRFFSCTFQTDGFVQNAQVLAGTK